MTDGYTPTYGIDETSEPVGDIMVGVLDGVDDFTALIALILIVGWIAFKLKKLRLI